MDDERNADALDAIGAGERQMPNETGGTADGESQTGKAKNASGNAPEPPGEKPKRQRLTDAQKIARYEQNIAKLRTRLKKRSRDLRTRELILIGATVTKAMRADPDFRDRIVALLRADGIRESDREVLAPWLSAT